MPRLTFACVVMFMMALALLPTGALAQEEVVIGHFAPMTGATATFGTSCDNGVRLALDEINAAGGILGGRKIKVITEDDQSRPDEAITAIQKLIDQHKVVAVLGEVTSTNTLAAASVAQRNRIPMLSPAATNAKVTKAGNYVFRSCFIDPFQGGAMATYATKELKMKRIAILYDIKSDYSTGLREFFTATAKANGAEIVADESFAAGDVDFKAQLTNIRKVNPDGIYCPGYYNEVGLICRQARELGLTIPLMGGDGWDSEQTFEIGREAVNGCYFTNHYSPEEDRPEVKKFVDGYKAKYGQVPDAMAILGYDAMKVMADAINRAGSTEPAKIRAALAATKDFPGASGTITIDKDRNARKSIVILKIEDDKAKFVTSIPPVSE